MKVILLQDVKIVGNQDYIVEANDGYARNVLLRKGLGVEASKKAVNDLKLKKANEDRVAKEKLLEAKKFAEELREKEVILKMKVGEGGRTFGAVSTKEIAEAAKKQLGYDLDKKKMHTEPIKTLGVHNIEVKVHPKVTATLKVKVQEDK